MVTVPLLLLRLLEKLIERVQMPMAMLLQQGQLNPCSEAEYLNSPRNQPTETCEFLTLSGSYASDPRERRV